MIVWSFLHNKKTTDLVIQRWNRRIGHKIQEMTIGMSAEEESGASVGFMCVDGEGCFGLTLHREGCRWNSTQVIESQSG